MAKSLFDHLNHIYEIQDIDYFNALDESDRKTFNVYMINRFISMNFDYLLIVNELQQYWNQLGPKEVYLFYSQILPKQRQFNKYIKGSKDSSPYEDWVKELIAQHFEISLSESEEYLRIFYNSDVGKQNLRSLLENYGTNSKKIKAAHL